MAMSCSAKAFTVAGIELMLIDSFNAACFESADDDLMFADSFAKASGFDFGLAACGTSLTF
jgi:hypothetical protein